MSGNTDAWEDYVAIEKKMFEAGAAWLRNRVSDDPEHLQAIIDTADEAGSDVGAVGRMIQGELEIPEGWNI